jgi:hypothetical protein
MVAAGTVGLAGCMGGGGSGGDSESGSNPEADDGSGGGQLSPLEFESGVAEGDDGFCSALVDAEFARYDESGSPFVATFEHPGDVAATATMNANHSLTVRVQVDGQPFDVFPSMNTDGTDQPTPAQKGAPDGMEPVATVDYAGETRPVVRAAGGSNGDDAVQYYKEYPYYVVGVPHEGTGDKQYYRYDFRATAQFAQELETGVCEATWERLAKRMVASLEPNEDTTVAEA